jgi:hypothetical protein
MEVVGKQTRRNSALDVSADPATPQSVYPPMILMVGPLLGGTMLRFISSPFISCIVVGNGLGLGLGVVSDGGSIGRSNGCCFIWIDVIVFGVALIGLGWT